VVKPEWGIKRLCQSCGARYYDFLRTPIVCPSCGSTFDSEAVLKSRRARPLPADDVKPKPRKEKAVVDPEEVEDAEEDEDDEVEELDDAETLDDVIDEEDETEKPAKGLPGVDADDDDDDEVAAVEVDDDDDDIDPVVEDDDEPKPDEPDR